MRRITNPLGVLSCFDGFLKLLDTWLDLIANNFINHQSSGFVEGLNNWGRLGGGGGPLQASSPTNNCVVVGCIPAVVNP